MTPRLSVIGASIRKLFSGTGGDGDLYWDSVVLGMKMDTPKDSLWGRTVLAAHMGEIDPHWSSTVLAMHMDKEPYSHLVSLGLNMDGADNGTTFTDVTGKTVSRFGNTVTKTGVKKFGASSAYFDGSGDYLTVPYSTDFYLDGDYTIELWVYLTGYKASHSVLVAIAEPTQTNFAALNLTVGSTGLVSFSVRSSTGGASVGGTTASPLALNSWHHIAVVRYDGVGTVYVNGVSSATIPSLPTLTDPNTSSVGVGFYANGTVGDYYHTGYIDDLRITKGLARYTKNFTTPVASGIGGLSDLKGKEVTVYGDAGFVTAQYPFGTGSVYFDGVDDYLTVPASADFNFGTGTLTIEAWVRSDLTQQGTIFDLWDGVDGTDTLVYITTSGAVTWFYEYSGGAGQSFSSSVGVIAANTWAHVACVREVSGALFIYVNGVKQANTVAKTTQMGKSTRTLHIGNRMNGTHAYKGYLSDYRITKGVSRYTRDFTPRLRPFREPVNTPLFVDEKGNLLAAYGAPTISTTLPKFGGASALFNGTTDYLGATAGSNWGFSTGDFTVEAWVKTTASGPVVDTRSTLANLGLFAINNGVIAVWNGANYLRGITSVTDGGWHHLAWVRFRGDLTLYVDGKIEATCYQVADYGTSRPLRIATNFDATAFFAGNINDLRITKAARYIGEFTPAAYSFVEDASSEVFIDETGKAVTVDGGAKVLAQSKYGSGAAYFDGVNDYVLVPGSPLLPATGDWTIECWIYRAVADNAHQIYSQGDTGINGRTFLLVESSNQLNFFVGSTTSLNLFSVTTIPAQAWTHVAVVKFNDTYTMYVNGVADGYGTSTQTIDQTSLNLIGRNQASALPRFFNGYIDDLRITKIARYLGNFTPPQTTFPAYARTYLDPYWNNVVLGMHMDGADNGTTFADVTGKTVTATNAVTKSAVKKFGTASAYFDGAGDYLSVPNSADFDFGTGDFTIEFWMNPSSVGSIMTLLSRYTSWPTAVAIYIHMTPSGAIQCRAANNVTIDVTSSSMLLAGYWYHVAISRAAGTTRMFINGNLKGSTSAAGSIGSTGGLGIGYELTGGSAYYHGYIDDLRITKGVARYTENFQPIQLPFPEKAFDPLPVVADPHLANVVLGMHMDGANDGTVFTEFTGKTVTRNGNVVTKTTVKRFGTASAYFNGNNTYLTVSNTSDFAFGVDDFTIELWANRLGFSPVDVSNALILIDFRSSEPGVGILLNFLGSGSPNPDKLDFYVNGVTRITSTSSFGADFKHIAIVRKANVTKLYIDGKQEGASYTDTNNYVASGLVIGGRFAATGGDFRSHNGYIDELRITKGVARYTENFTPPGAFPEVRQVWDDPYFSSVVLLMHMDGADNGTTFTDVKGKSVSRFGNVCTKAAVKKFGTASAYFDGVFSTDGEHLTVPMSTDFNFGSGNFTIEAWVQLVSLPTVAASLFSTSFNTDPYYSTRLRILSTGAVYVGLSTNGGSSINHSITSSAGLITTGQFHHVAAVRNGETLRLFINGVAVGVTTGVTGSVYYATRDPVQVGVDYSSHGTPSLREYLNGYIDELRVTKGVARYATSFDPGQAPFPDA